ncbi:hypothetical protein GCM10008968_21100 [Bacillus horti]
MEENEKPYGRLQWVFYIVLVPALFTLILVGIIFTFLGYNVIDATKSFFQNIPVVSALFNSEDDETEGVAEETEPTINLEEELAQKDTELEGVQTELIALKSDLQQREMKILELEQTIEEMTVQEEQNVISAKERTKQIRELAQLYGGMSAKRAAAILENLTLTEAALIIREMDSQQRSGILTRFDPAFAAQLTVTLQELDTVDDPEMAALQERVKLLMGMLNDNLEATDSRIPLNNMVNTLSQLPTAQAVEMLTEMSGSDADFALATTFLAIMSDESRSTIFAQMDPEVAIKFTKELTKLSPANNSNANSTASSTTASSNTD